MTKDKTALIIDNGMFVTLAAKISEHFKKTYLYINWKESYPHMARAMVGSEWKNGRQLPVFNNTPMERIENMFDYIDEADIVIFLDVYDGDLSKWLHDQGKLVFGPMKGEELELERFDTKEYFKKIGMDVTGYKKIIGMDALKAYLEKENNKWVKISKFRRVMETFHHTDFRLTKPALDKMEYELGPMAKVVEFFIEDDIKAVVEEGVDTYTADGKFPNYILSGIEVKDASYAGKFIRYSDLSLGLKEVDNQISPILKKYGYRGFISTEVRTTADGKHYLIDPCCRAGSPPSEVYQEMFTNLGDIVWNTAEGKIIDPIPKKLYAMEAIMISEHLLNSHQAVYFPPEFTDNVKLKNPMIVDGTWYNLKIDGCSIIGAIVAVGNSFEDCKKQIEEIAPQVVGQGIECKVDKLDDAEEEWHKMNEISKK